MKQWVRVGSLRLCYLAGLIASMFLLYLGCLPKRPADRGGINITLYGFSIMQEPLEHAIFPGFAAMWRRKHGQEVHFTSSFAGSETITNQILQGVAAQVAILSISLEADRLAKAGFIRQDWHSMPHHGIVNRSPFLIVVRKRNPQGIHDFADLAKPGVKLIHADPGSSGGAQWSILAMYGSLLNSSSRQPDEGSRARALQTLRAIWSNVISTPGSTREARTQFEAGFGNAFITYEIEALSMQRTGKPVEIIVPKATIFSEHPAVVIGRNVKPERRPLIDAFMQYLWSEEAQRSFVQFDLRAAADDATHGANPCFAHISKPFTVDNFGGWNQAYSEVIQKIFRNQVENRR